jgi:hypothetical protein
MCTWIRQFLPPLTSFQQGAFFSDTNALSPTPERPEPLSVPETLNRIGSMLVAGDPKVNESGRCVLLIELYHPILNYRLIGKHCVHSLSTRASMKGLSTPLYGAHTLHP